jgi:hypothetical protein
MLILIFGVIGVFLFGIKSVNAVCTVTCTLETLETGEEVCLVGGASSSIGSCDPDSELAGVILKESESVETLQGWPTSAACGHNPDSFCSASNQKCELNKFPTGDDGQKCAVIDRCFDILYDCKAFAKYGVLDAYENQCVVCNDKKENGILGDTTTNHNNSTGFYVICGDETPGTGDGKCESACGADAACDEKSPGDACDSNGEGTDDGRCMDR